MIHTYQEAEIVNKIYRGDKLSDEEEILYMTEVMGYSEDEAKKLIYIVDNTKPGVILD